MTLEEVEKLALNDIKAMVYDELAKAEIAQKNIQALNQIISKKSQPQPPVKAAEPGQEVKA